jgi:hypothetical protein
MSSTTQISTTNFPIPFTKEQLREAILAIYLLQARQAYLFCNEKTTWPLAGPVRVEEPGILWIGENSAEDFGIAYDMIRSSHFALALEQEYEFAFHGKVTDGVEPMTYESMHMWVADLLMDLNDSQLVLEWESYGVDLQAHIARCLHVCELANARIILEGAEPFSHFAGLDGAARKTKKHTDDTATSLDGLTIRQMSLLSGMEEMSIRTAASRQGPNMLPTFKDENRRTLVKPEDAKKWLIAKERYLAIDSGEQIIDLAKTRVTSAHQFNDLMSSRIRQLSYDIPSRMNRLKQVGDLVATRGLTFKDVITREMLMDNVLMTAIATVLELPPDLVAVRARQAALQDEVRELEDQIMLAPAHKAPSN